MSGDAFGTAVACWRHSAASPSVSSHPEGSAYLHKAADEDGAAAAGAAEDKRRRYPAWALPGGRLIPFSVETFGRWGREALDFMRSAADAVAEQNEQVACRGHWGKASLLNAWHSRLSVALQKGNAKCLLQAGRVRGFADFVGTQTGKTMSRIFCGRLPPLLASEALRPEGL